MKLLLSWILTQAKKPGRKSMAECFHRLKKAKAFTQRLMTGVHLNLPMKSEKKTRGHYYRVEFCAPGDLIKEIERYLRLDEKVMRYLTVLIDENADIEQIKAEISDQENPETTEEKSEIESEETTETSTEEDLQSWLI
eukprot:TRINITY_DN8446_c0_g1_i1.p1 TRINITY_DN8446_c0_g1~~TRINITY_DN8446_c0_g1_i1.p1  ORF type:complete len:138 (+),score=15.96 TRINITY_DN8446_c0_g1_i1:258-671(+)